MYKPAWCAATTQPLTGELLDNCQKLLCIQDLKQAPMYRSFYHYRMISSCTHAEHSQNVSLIYPSYSGWPMTAAMRPATTYALSIIFLYLLSGTQTLAADAPQGCVRATLSLLFDAAPTAAERIGTTAGSGARRCGLGQQQNI
jgi:hypothetical protein